MTKPGKASHLSSFAGLAAEANPAAFPTLGASAGESGTGAPAGRRLTTLVAVLALALLGMAAASSSAFAAYIHPAPNYSFGPDGGTGTNFGANHPRYQAYQQATDRLYVISRSGGDAYYIYGFHRNAPESYSPLGGNFPLEPPKQGQFFGLFQIAVDNSGTSTAGKIYYVPDYGPIYGFTPSGTPVGSFQTSGEPCGVAVDNEGYVWVGNWGTAKLEKFSPSGGSAVDSVDTSTQGRPCYIGIDSSTNDIYAAMSGGVWKYTKASGYASGSAVKFPTPWSYDAQPVINPVFNKLYILGPDGSFNVKAYSTGGGFLEEFGLSGGCNSGTGAPRGLSVANATDTVFVSDTCSEKIQEWRGAIVPDSTTGEPIGDKKVSGSVGLAGGGEVTECYFQWREKGVESEYQAAHKAACVPATPYNADQPSVTAEISALQGEHTYIYRLVARNANGPGIGAEKEITPHNVKGLMTGIADGITRVCATLHASFEGNGENTGYWFEYGESSNPYSSKTTEQHAQPGVGVTYQISETVCGLKAGHLYHYRVAGKNGIGESKAVDKTFETNPAVKSVTTEPATEIKTETAILNGSLDPDGYVTHYYFEIGKTANYGESFPVVPAEVGTTAAGVVQVSAEATNLEQGAEYHFRLVGVNETGETRGLDKTFVTKARPSITSFSSRNVTESTAELYGNINPNGYDTTYWFEYGTTPAYGSTVPIPAKTLTASTTIEPVEELITSLQPVTYHFRLVAKSEWGTTYSEDQTFDYFPPRCPNENERQQTGAAYLPDCRAYELVSPGRAGGALLTAGGPWSATATDPARFTFAGSINAIPGTGEVGNGDLSLADTYVASRTPTGWYTRYLGLPSSMTLNYGGFPWTGEFPGVLQSIPADTGMEKFLVWDWGCCLEGISAPYIPKEGSYSPYVISHDGEIVGRLPTNIGEIPGALKDVKEGGYKGSTGVSADFSHYVFSTNDLVFAEGGITEVPGSVYDNNIAAESVVTVSKTPKTPSGNIMQDPVWGSGNEYLKVQAVSANGSHILMSTQGRTEVNSLEAGYFPQRTRHLYLTVNDTVHYEPSLAADGKNHAVTFLRMTSDGSTIYLLSKEQLTPEDTDNGTDIYVWKEAEDSLTLVSKGTGTTGNRSICGVSWTENCNAVPVIYAPPWEEQNKYKRDLGMATDSGDLYFYSAEQLDGGRGEFGKRNLYVFRGGVVRWVATLKTKLPRLNIAPDGRIAAFVTTTQLTPYDNEGFEEMYRYRPSDRTIICVSCDPTGAAPHSSVEASQNGRFMTNDGRTFFATEDGLVARDANRTWDIYEFVDGRPQLISPGTGDNAGNEFSHSALSSVSGDGKDVYFTTYNTLVPQDENGPFIKFYDARSGGGFPYNKPAAPCAAADECHGPETTEPTTPVIGTGANLGATGNVKRNHRHRKHCGKHRKRCRHGKHKGHHGSRRHG